ncbi:MAG: endonuclease/exonuclease/phosphatase family protein [Pirellulales bacterium]|nr:endonuclease/exonuclease/phosphatase family protein [Pirellulales bacterium]
MAILNKMNRRTVVLLAIGLIVTLGVWHASLRVGTGPASGEGIEDFPSEARAASSTVRIGTLNMASGRGRDGIVDLGRTADVLEGLDLVALQEARGGFLFRTDNQAAMLARFRRCGWLYAPTETRWHCKQFGNAVLSNLPVRHWQRIPLPRQFDRSYRNMVFLTLDHGRRPIHVIATHATQRDPRDRKVQLDAAIEFFLALEEPAILLGDLNSLRDSPVIRQLAAREGVDEPIGRLVDAPPKGQVDWIFVRGLQCVAAGVRDEGVSDHPLYWVEIEVPGDEKSLSPGKK